jgi:uncharacterized membrane protein
MDKKQKRNLIIAGIVEVIVLIFCLVITIIVLTKSLARGNDSNMTPAQIVAADGPFIGWLETNPTWFFCLIVLPLFVIFIADGVYLIVYVSKKQSALSDKERDTIQEEARRQAREELLKEMRGEGEAKPSEEPKAADPKPADPAPKAEEATAEEKK